MKSRVRKLRGSMGSWNVEVVQVKSYIIIVAAIVTGLAATAGIGYGVFVAYPAWKYDREAPARAALIKACAEFVQADETLEYGHGAVMTANAWAEVGKDRVWRVRVDVGTGLAGSTILSRPAFCTFNADGTIQEQANFLARKAAKEANARREQAAERLKIESDRVTPPVTEEDKASFQAASDAADRVFRALQNEARRQ